MKVVILAGGFGTRFSEETAKLPKPMIPIGEKPIIWHIMKAYSAYGFNEFVICLGYKGYVIKEWFTNYFLHNNDVTIDLKTNDIKIHKNKSEPWKVTLVETGLNTMTGGRIKRIQDYIGDERFLLTYGDGVSDVNIKELIEFHEKNGKSATLTGVQPGGKYGALKIEGDKCTEFGEKKDNTCNWINGGFFVLEPEVFDLIDDDKTIWERNPLESLSKNGQLMVYKHTGFWKSMDKLYDKIQLDKLWENGAPWKIW